MRYNISMDDHVSSIADMRAEDMGLSRSAYISQLIMKDNGTSPYSNARYKFQAVIGCLMSYDDFPSRMDRARQSLSFVIDAASMPPRALAMYNHLSDMINRITADETSMYSGWYIAAKKMNEFEKAEFLSVIFQIYDQLRELS